MFSPTHGESSSSVNRTDSRALSGPSTSREEHSSDENSYVNDGTTLAHSSNGEDGVHERKTSRTNPGDTARTRSMTEEKMRDNVNATLSNPLANFSPEELQAQGREYAKKHYLGEEEDIRAFELGAWLAQDPLKHQKLTGLTLEEQEVLANEVNSRWSQPKLMYLVIVLCSTCAAVQGMDETVVNGAQVFYTAQFGIDDKNSQYDSWIVGLLNSAPYLCAACIGCWLTVPFNNLFGRRGTIFITCLFSVIACFWQGFTNAWWSMFIARFALGFGIGPKSATVPIYAAETTPPAIRGAMVMQWQMWTAFGIMLGYAADLAFFNVQDTLGVTGLNWRLMMGSAMLPAVVVCCFVSLCPESPRWYMSKGMHYQAYQAMYRLRHNKIQAARDIFYMHVLLEAEAAIHIPGKFKMLELVRVPRNRRAMVGSEILMFMQQFCGVNIIAYYSSNIFLDANFSESSALLASFGFGLINWLFAIPAVYTIDTFGRRNLLLTTFPLMSLFLFLTGFSFYIPDQTAKVACIAVSIYLFGMTYSPGEGPVPFTYTAECYPLYVRSLGVSLGTATNWFFNFILSVTFPSLQQAFSTTGAFCFYAGWNIVGFFLVLCFVPETKEKTLEELDQVFGVPTHVHAAWGLRQLPYFVKRYVLRQTVEPEELYQHETVNEETGFVLAPGAELGNRAAL